MINYFKKIIKHINNGDLNFHNNDDMIISCKGSIIILSNNNNLSNLETLEDVSNFYNFVRTGVKA